MKKIILILGDQLSHNISSLQFCDKKTDIIMLCENWNEATYVKHHVKKIAFLFSAMRHFAKELKEKNYKVDYLKLDPKDKKSSFTSSVKKVAVKHNASQVVVTHPGEYRVLKEIESWPSKLKLDVDIVDDDRFLCDIDDFKEWEKNYKQPRMEFFYRYMRQKYNFLVKNGKPIGGKWNFDAENRKPAKENLKIKKPFMTKPDKITTEVIKLVEANFKKNFGEMDDFHFAVTRKDALKSLKYFIDNNLKNFGAYQDIMLENEPWLYHSHISQYINCGLLDPMECIECALEAYKQKKAPINSVEGFIRQILGWREYIRGVYWLKMPGYVNSNYLKASKKLPEFFWTGETDMNCLKQCINETAQNAYAHHIQRLMVLGNFCLLTGINPKYVNEWYLIVYADAYEWVELPNVSGMILFADGGYVASKPYAAGGAYINKMSNYCSSCKYNVKEKVGEKACPFNYLYWNFLINNKDKLNDNQRLALVYSSLKRMDKEKIKDIKKSSAKFMKELN